MTTRIDSGPAPSVSTSQTAARTTPAPARPFKAVMHAGASAVITGAERTLRQLPGGPLLAAAVRATPATPSAGSAEGSAGTADAAGGAGAGAGAERGQIESALDQQAEQNLYYLGLQERISAESRAYSAMSNVLKARHDTVKNAIGNIR